jgi:hypothetical protein
MLVFALEALHSRTHLIPSYLPSLLLLSLAVVITATLLYLTPRSQAIQLPTTTASSTEDLLLPLLEKEPDVELDSAGDNDENGSGGFYARLRVRKLVTSAAFVGLVGVEVFTIAWEGVRGGKRWEEWVERGVMLAVWVRYPLPPSPQAPAPATAITHLHRLFQNMSVGRSLIRRK